MVGSNPTREALEDIAEHMAHTTVTSEKIYRHRQRHVKAVATFEKIQSVSGKLANTLNHKKNTNHLQLLLLSHD